MQSITPKQEPRSVIEAANLVYDFLQQQYRDWRSKPRSRHDQDSDYHNQEERRKQDGHNGQNGERHIKYNGRKPLAQK